MAAITQPRRPGSRPIASSPWSNWQTYLFSGAAHCDHAAVDLLPAALRNLEQMDFVGIHEELEAGVRRLAELRGWTLQPALPRVNVTAGRPPLEAINPALVDRLPRAQPLRRGALCARARAVGRRADPTRALCVAAGHSPARRAVSHAHRAWHARDRGDRSSSSPVRSPDRAAPSPSTSGR